jgi:predicted metal-dependent peptidase
MPRRKQQAAKELDQATKQFDEGVSMLYWHPLFHPLFARASVIRTKQSECPREGWAVVSSSGDLHVHPTRRCTPDEWVYVLAHCLLHLGLDHLVERARPLEWNAACDVMVDRFLRPLKLGTPPPGFVLELDFQARDEQRLYEELCRRGLPEGYHSDMLIRPPSRHRDPVNWQRALGEGLAAAVTSAVEVASGRIERLGEHAPRRSLAQEARAWFINSYPLLGALAAAFTIVEDPHVCNRLGISVAAVNTQRREIYMHPAAALDEQECRFVMAHELLHVGLRHDARCQGRDLFLWNVACDYVINGWLVEMAVGHMPSVGLLYDPALKGESAESIYDLMATDMRRYRKLATLRGIGVCDLLEPTRGDWWTHGDGVDLDRFYRQALAQGLTYHCGDSGRGFLPLNLIEEINALAQPPVPWDVELARWFEHYFPPLERRRSYARPSRRQDSTPDIARPRYVPDTLGQDARTFGVVLDTSGSMDRTLLAKALGAIASYSLAHEVPAARVVFCDAAPYDEGYLPPEDIAGRVRVRGRGGTVLQPAIDLLEQAEDFPPEGPLLIITDGMCDRLRIRREHAFLMPQGRHLPFVPRGPVFRIT